jgi:hypothetical protein
MRRDVPRPSEEGRHADKRSPTERHQQHGILLLPLSLLPRLIHAPSPSVLRFIRPRHTPESPILRLQNPQFKACNICRVLCSMVSSSLQNRKSLTTAGAATANSLPPYTQRPPNIWLGYSPLQPSTATTPLTVPSAQNSESKRFPL